jgi:demethylspheroidene O-methyltransferase
MGEQRAAPLDVPPLLERWRSFRDRFISAPRFQRWAAAFPLTRGLAARRASALFDLCAGFVYSQVLLACVRLDVFALLADGPRGAQWLAQRTGLEEAATTRLLDAAVALDLLEHRGTGLYGLGELGAALVGNPAVVALIQHHELLYADLADPVALLRGRPTSRRLADHWPYAGTDCPESLTTVRVSAYTSLMAASQPLVAQDVLDAYPFERHTCLLDVGGGDGTFLAAAAERASRLRLKLFDLPAVVGQARARLAGTSLESRIELTAGNFLRDPLPAGADVASLIRVLHDHDDPEALAILRAVGRAVGPGGVVVVGEPLAGVPGAGPMGAAYFGFYLPARGSGKPRTARQLSELMQAAGFAGVHALATIRPLLAGVLTGQFQRSESL